MKFIDLCCGIGGFHQALSNLGFECVLASDIDKDCRDNYFENYGIEPVGDMIDIDVKTIPEFNILCAGFPCQPFSKAGEQKGFDDNRGNIFFEICKIVKHHKPEYIILENVRNLASHDKGNTWSVIKTQLRKLKYNVYDDCLILNTLYFGVPQSRERVVILCKRQDLGDLPPFPELSKKNILETSLKSIVESSVSPKYKLTGKLKVVEKVWNEFLQMCIKHNIDVPKFPIWTDWWDSDGENTTVTKFKKGLTQEENEARVKEEKGKFYKKYKNWIDKNREFYQSNKKVMDKWLLKSRKNQEWIGAVRKMEWQTGQQNLTMKDVLWSPRGSGVRIKKIDYAPTLVAMASMIPVYGPESRMLTPRECARLQSFPDSYILHEKDKVAYKQFGNAVNVKMIEQCAMFLIFEKPLMLES